MNHRLIAISTFPLQNFRRLSHEKEDQYDLGHPGSDDRGRKKGAGRCCTPGAAAPFTVRQENPAFTRNYTAPVSARSTFEVLRPQTDAGNARYPERGKKQIMIKYLFYCNIICLTCQYLKRIYICYSKQSARKIEIF